MANTTNSTIFELILLVVRLVQEQQFEQEARQHEIMERARARTQEEQRRAQERVNELKAEQAKRDEITSASWKQTRLELADRATNLARVLSTDEEVLEEINDYRRRIHQIGEKDPSLRATELTPAEQAREEFLAEPREDLDKQINQLSDDLGLLVGAQQCEQEGLPFPDHTEKELHGARERVSDIEKRQRERSKRIKQQREREHARERSARPPHQRVAAHPKQQQRNAPQQLRHGTRKLANDREPEL